MRARFRHTPIDPRHRHPRRGSVILFVLGLVLLTALLLTRFIERANTELIVEARTVSQVPLRDEAYAELQVAFAVLADFTAVDNGLHSPAQGWGTPLVAAHYTPPAPFQSEVRIEDESAKLSLARIDGATFQKFLVAIGCLPTEAERISDAILTWTRPDYAPQFTESDTSSFAQLDPPLVPPRVALRTWAELRLLPAVRQSFMDDNGDWNPLGRRFLANVSLIPFDRVNLNTAGREVLDAAGVDADAVLALRGTAAGSKSPGSDQIFYTAADLRSSLGTTPDAAQAGVDVACLRIVITTRQGDRKFRLVALVKPGASAPPAGLAAATPAAPPSGGSDQLSQPRPSTSKNIDSPFTILDIRENPDR